ncbi:tetratricopeptide repeat protein [Rhodocytophaga rosea]|uniref:Tetratricopeptide repeat protein n=1 Tax=Rhodocytophaga rosea TaxID=2704465 RepID=A0A6C0GS05_9BACT|nr:tetratricopeptide repeat protein [Rhodocytophaga rosea]QHT70717.1 tetratricopeptide repeat protein [Rhodocytophaga rosea]
MEVFILFVILLACVLLQAFLFKHEDQTAKDAKQYAEGIRLVNNKKFKEAYTYFDQVIKARPSCALAHMYRGKCNLALDDLYAAIFDCTEAASFDDCIAESYLVKGIALFKLEMYKDAFLEFDKAVWHYRNHGESFRWRALSRLKLGFAEKAEEDLLRAIELGDEHANYFLQQKGKIEI